MPSPRPPDDVLRFIKRRPEILERASHHHRVRNPLQDVVRLAEAVDRCPKRPRSWTVATVWENQEPVVKGPSFWAAARAVLKTQSFTVPAIALEHGSLLVWEGQPGCGGPRICQLVRRVGARRLAAIR